MTWVGTGMFGLAGALLLALSASLARSAQDFDTHAVDVAGVISGHEPRQCTRKGNKNNSRTYT